MRTHVWQIGANPYHAVCLACGKQIPLPIFKTRPLFPEEEECPYQGRDPEMTPLKGDDFKEAK